MSPVESAFARELFERYQLSLYRYLTRLLHSREEAQEILQETYLRILRQPTFEHVRANARAYLFQTATNLARDLFRQKALRGIESERALFNASGLDSPDWDSWPELALEAEQAGRAIVDVLQELDPQVRSALLLHRFRGLEAASRSRSGWVSASGHRGTLYQGRADADRRAAEGGQMRTPESQQQRERDQAWALLDLVENDPTVEQWLHDLDRAGPVRRVG